MSNEVVWFRPQDYWPAHTTVTFTAHLSGVQAAPRGVRRPETCPSTSRSAIRWVAVASNRHPLHEGLVEREVRGQLGDQHRAARAMTRRTGSTFSFAMGNPVDMNSASFGRDGPGDPGYYKRDGV